MLYDSYVFLIEFLILCIFEDFIFRLRFSLDFDFLCDSFLFFNGFINEKLEFLFLSLN